MGDLDKALEQFYKGKIDPSEERLKKGLVSIQELDSMALEDLIEEFNFFEVKKIPAKIVITSPGGSVFIGLAVHDLIKTFRGGTVTIGYGEVASMAGIILQAGKKRLATPQSWMLIHEISSLTMGKTSDIIDEAKLLERMQEQVLDILAEKSKLTKREIQKKWKRKDWWLDTNQMLELGFIDGIYDGKI